MSLLMAVGPVWLPKMDITFNVALNAFPSRLKPDTSEGLKTGLVDGVTLFEAAEDTLVPALLVAVTVKE